MEACRARSEPRELERANLGRRRPSVLDAGACQHCVTFPLDADLWYWTPGRVSTVSSFRWAPERASSVSLWPGTLEWSGGVRRR
jgi:hypothetical protein